MVNWIVEIEPSMQMSRITEPQVEAFLKAMRSGEKAGVQLLKLDAVKHPEEASDDELLILQTDYLLEATHTAYAAARKTENLPPSLPHTRADSIVQIGIDFSLGNAELESWSAVYYRYFADIPFSVDEISTAASIVPQQYRRRLKLGISNLTTILKRAELEFKKHPQKISSQLPLPDFTRLVGVEAYFQELRRLLNDPAGPQMISLEGFGGIGKTALTRAFVGLPDTRARWTRILWVSARQFFLDDVGRLAPSPAAISTLEDITVRLAEQLGLGEFAARTLRERIDGISVALATEPTLVVIDNLETVTEYRALIPSLTRCAGKDTRFLITTRMTLSEFPYVQVLKVHELNGAFARNLLENELARRGRTLHLDETDFEQLYHMIGGIPLALKLVASQLSFQSLRQILKSFQEVKSGTSEFYTYLYWQAWQLLSDSARNLMLSFLPADPEGEDLEFIQQMSGLTEESFYAGLRELDQLSLLESDGSTILPRYRLHRLTVTFLQSDLLKLWIAPSHDDDASFSP